ncbi:MAG TPA: hypothetical protein DCR43_04580 [Bacteroidales bacterium]|nr:MAG: hypothetical protein A2X11_00925 [Bacteroidetes bacterium GWE2_42_24]OFY27476.1 MAG: hypothetical protein A2X09_07300 [Bacteroidetes bacterium GWF2_43_11]PKP23482.1 MAG: hypothetical protein CVU06_08045 [Bacteroidetes bacterium HGW-Bacteroidetes-22]HAQ65115.1 hypothetical protein [Bacteroidales bacterium]HBZ65994.1 hypothetical protein [Bacteroidales bacterium]
MRRLILITGLPFFGSKIAKQLQEIDPTSKYIYLNTYYSVKDRLRYLLLVWFCDCLYSINGTLSGSKVISLALLLQKRVIFHWAGSDVTQAVEDTGNNRVNRKFIEKPVHLAVAPWFIEELAAIDIKATFHPLMNVGQNIPLIPFPDKFGVLIYIPGSNPEYYGFSRLIAIARQLPECLFYVAGMDGNGKEAPSNIVFLGWVQDMTTAFAKASITIRIPWHDGLAFFVLESLLYGRYVLYSQPFHLTRLVKDNNDIIKGIRQYMDLYQKGELQRNFEGMEYVKNHFSREKVLKPLVDLLKG